MLGGAESRKVPETSDSRFETMLWMDSQSSAQRTACSRTSAPSSVSRNLRVDRSISRTPSWSSSSASRHGEAIGLHDLREYQQGIQIHHAFPQWRALIFANYSPRDEQLPCLGS